MNAELNNFDVPFFTRKRKRVEHKEPVHYQMSPDLLPFSVNRQWFCTVLMQRAFDAVREPWMLKLHESISSVVTRAQQLQCI